MFTFGSQVNPSLLRQDFSPILQAAQAQAQATQQAAAIRAQSMAQLGSTIGKSIESYAATKEKNAVLEGKNAQLFNALASDPSLNGVINRSPTIQKLIAQRDQKGGLDLNSNTKLFAELSTAYEMVKESRENQMKQVYAEQARASVNKMAYDLDQAKKTDEAWGRYSELSRGFTDKTTYDDKVKAVAEAGLPPEAASRALGNVITAEQLGLQRQQIALQTAEASAKLAEQAQNREFLENVINGKESGYRINRDAQTGLNILTNTKTGASTVLRQPQVKPPQGEKIASIVNDYWIGKGQNDPVKMDIALENYRAAMGRDGPLMSREMLVAGVEGFGRGGKLEVTGPLKRVEQSPQPTTEDRRVTQPANPSEASAATPTQTPTLAPTLAPTQTPAPLPAPRPPVQDIIIPPSPPTQTSTIPPNLPTQDIILDDAFVRRPGVSGSFKVDPQKSVADDDYEFGARGLGYLPQPGEKLRNVTQTIPILRRMEGELKLSKARLELLEPKAKDTADTIALKKVIPYLPNPNLSLRLLKELSEGKQLNANALKGDPFARSLFAAVKEGRLSQLNMAAIGGS